MCGVKHCLDKFIVTGVTILQYMGVTQILIRFM